MHTTLRIVTVSLAAAVLAPPAEGRPPKSKPKLEWQSGKILSAEMAGHGRPPRKLHDGTPIPRGADIWWVYRFDIGGRVYSASSRANPAKAKLEAGRSAWFAVSQSRKRIYVYNENRRQYQMQIMRDDAASAR